MYQYTMDIQIESKSTLEKDIESFKRREVKAKSIFWIEQVSKSEAYEFVKKYHYLADAKFFSMYAFGMFHCGTGELVGVATYSCPQGNVALKGWFGLDNSCKNILELSRLCVLPQLNGTNASSFLLGGSIKCLERMNEDARRNAHKEKREFSDNDWICRAVITLSTSDRHVGSIYQVCNFKYYGLSDAKTDFYAYVNNDAFLKNPRGETKNRRGVWLPRPRKHRYAYILDKKLNVKYPQIDEYPQKGDTLGSSCCCGEKFVIDGRFGDKYTCPVCTGKLMLLGNENG